MEFVFPAGDWKQVEEPAASHVYGKLEKRGLRKVGLYDVDTTEKKKRLSLDACESALIWHTRQRDQHIGQQKLQEEKKFPPLPESPASRNAERLIPIYEEHIAKLRDELEIDDTKAAQDEARKALQILDAPPPVPGLAEMELPQLRKLAIELGLDFNINANAVTLRKMVRDHQDAEKEKADATVGS
jgi:hypothetical protein